MIRDYEDGMLSDVRFLEEALKRQMKDDIISLSIKYAIVSQYTR
jgi:hypothetical protein